VSVCLYICVFVCAVGFFYGAVSGYFVFNGRTCAPERILKQIVSD
jgi:hypothetical protein